MALRKRKRKTESGRLKGPRGEIIKQYHRGYCRLYIRGFGHISEHRYVMQELLGRKLKRSEHVHHIDRNKLNNHPDNLHVLSQKEHYRLHANDMKIKNGISIN